MPEKTFRMQYQEAAFIIRKYEKDVTDGIITDPEVIKKLDISRKVVYYYWIKVFRRMK